MSEGKIYGALAAVMAEVGHVGKERKNLQQNYQFRGIDDVMAACQPVLAKHGVVVVPRVMEREREERQSKSGGAMFHVRFVVEHLFYANDGSNVACVTVGEAMDSGDKASNKAMSAALKYALVETLMIPTYEADRDTEDASPEVKPTRAKKPEPATQRTDATGLVTQAPREVPDITNPPEPDPAAVARWDEYLAMVNALHPGDAGKEQRLAVFVEDMGKLNGRNPGALYKARFLSLGQFTQQALIERRGKKVDDLPPELGGREPGADDE